MACLSDYHQYDLVPPVQERMMANHYPVIYEIPESVKDDDDDDHNYHDNGTTSQTDLSLSFLDLSLASEFEVEDDDDDDSDVYDDFASDYDCNRTSDSKIVGDDDDDEEEEEEDEDEFSHNHQMEAHQYILELLSRIAPSSPPPRNSSGESCPSSGNSAKATNTSTSSSSSSSSSSHRRVLDFDNALKNDIGATLGLVQEGEKFQAKRRSKLKRSVPRMGTRLDWALKFGNIPVSHQLLPPLESASSPEPQKAPFYTLASHSTSQQPQPKLSTQQHIYQDLVFDLPPDSDSSANCSTNEEPFYHVLSIEHLAQQQHELQQQQQKQRQNKSLDQEPKTTYLKTEHRVSFNLRKSNEEDIYENDYEVQTLLKNFPQTNHPTVCPPPLPKRPTQVKFTPIVQSQTASSSSDSSSASSTLVIPSKSQKSNSVDSVSNGNKIPIVVNSENIRFNSTPKKQKDLVRAGSKVKTSSAEVTGLSVVIRDSSSEGETCRREHLTPRDKNTAISRIYRDHSMKQLHSSASDRKNRKVVVLGEGEVDGRTGEIYGKLAEVMYTNRENLQHTIRIQQKLFQQQLQSSPTTVSSKVQDAAQLHQQTQQHQQRVWNLASPQQQQAMSPQQSGNEWVIRRRPDGTRYITRRGKHPKVRESKNERKVSEKSPAPVAASGITSSPTALPTIMPIFRAKRKPTATKELCKYPTPVLKVKPVVQLDSFAALQNVLQGKLPTQNHTLSPKQNQVTTKPLLSVTTI